MMLTYLAQSLVVLLILTILGSLLGAAMRTGRQNTQR